MNSHEKDTRTIGELVRLYQVGFRLQPGEAVIVSGRRTQFTCRQELSGHQDRRIQCGNAPCVTCIQVLQALFEVADILRPIERGTFERAGIACETSARYASAAGPGHEETLGFEMTLRHPLGAMADRWAWIFMQIVRTALRELGCRDRDPAEPVGCRPPFRTVRRGFTQCDATSTSMDAMDRESRLIA